MTRLLAALMAAAIAIVAPAVAPAAAQENDATAVNKKDGKSVFKLAFQVKQVNDSDVDAENSATAFASCEDCRTVAAAIQVVLVTDPDSLEAENSAVAINYQCTECETLAAAYQFVIAGGEELEFTKEGQERLRELRKEFKALKQRDDLTTAQLATEIARIAGEVAEVVDSELVSEEDNAPDGSTTTSTPETSSTTTDVTTSSTTVDTTGAPTSVLTTTSTP
jgi:putative peptide zinc metalloprotease protein